MAKVIFGEWLPDYPENENPGAILAKNVLPGPAAYKQFLSLSAFSNALDEACVGNFSARATNETVFNFAGDAGKLYLLSGSTTWTDVSQAATTYSASFWDFVAFQNRVIATDGGGSPLQYYDMNVSSEFADLPGTPPRVKALGVVRDFVVGGNYALGSEVEPGGLAWSGFNNTELWTPSLSTQANRVPGRGAGGQVQRIVPGSIGVVFLEKAIRTMQYVGPPTVFKTDEQIVDHGTPAPRSVAWTKDFVFYYSEEGFFQLDRKTLALTPIGVNKVNDWFLSNSAQSDRVNMICAVRQSKNLVYWAFRSSASSVLYDRILVYNYAPNVQRFTYAELSLEWLGSYATVSANLDTLDSVLGSGGIDINSIPVDTDAYLGGVASFLAFTSLHEAATFDGTALTAEIDTTEVGLENARMMINGVRPIVTGGPTMLQVAPLTRNLPNDNAALGSFVDQNADTGQCDLRSSGRYQRFRVKIVGGFRNAQRVEYEVKKRGRR
jgi:hypothetical protein